MLKAKILWIFSFNPAWHHCRGENGPLLPALLFFLFLLLLQLAPGGGRGHHVRPHRRRHRRLRRRTLLPEEARSAVQGHAAPSEVGRTLYGRTQDCMNCLTEPFFLPRCLNSLRPSQVSAGTDRASVRRRRGRGGSRRHRPEISPNHFHSHPLAVIYFECICSMELLISVHVLGLPTCCK